MADKGNEAATTDAMQPSNDRPQRDPKAGRQPSEAAGPQGVASEEARASKPADADQPSPGKAAPQGPAAKGGRKWVKPLLVAIVCILVAAIAVGAFFVWQAGEKRSIASAAVEQLKGSEAVAGLVIPSDWGDQAGFSVGGVDVDAVDSGIIPSGNVRVAVKADLDNGSYAGQGSYDITMRKDGSAWVADGIQQTALSYYPVSGISDEVLLDRMPQLVSEASALARTDYDELPDPAAVFGEGAAGEVLANDFDYPTDSVGMMFEAQRDGIPYQVGLTVDFEWVDAGGEPADWHLAVATFDDEAYLIAGSFLREGVEMPDDYVPLAQNEWLASISPQLDFRSGSHYAWAFLKNPPDSAVDIEVSIVLDDGQVIYTSPRIPPNCALDTIWVDQLPPTGVYDAKARFRAYEGGTPVDENTLDTRVIVS